jgi:hypothetical protein
MSSEYGEVREMLHVLAAQVWSCKEPFDAQAVSNSLYGLQGMSSEHVEVREMLRVLTAQVSSCDEPLVAQSVGNALYGLQGMSSECEEAREMLRVLARQVSTCKEPLNAQEVGNALYGLQGMSSGHVEMWEMLSVLRLQLMSHKSPSLSAQGIGMALFGLQHIQLDDSWLPIISSICSKDIKAVLAELPMRINDRQYFEGIESLNQHLSIVLGLDCVLRGFVKTHGLFEGLQQDHKEVGITFDKLLAANTSYCNKGPRSQAEKRYMRILREWLGDDLDHGLEMETNKYLHGFEADILLRGTTTTASKGADEEGDTGGVSAMKDIDQPRRLLKLINIEIDGVHHHSQHRKKTFCKYRDLYLQQVHGVHVVRVDAMRANTDKEYRAQMRKTLQSIASGQ